MNWDAIGAIGEVVGAAAVVGSLLYLAGQVRMSARASAVESKMQSTTLLYAYSDSLINSPDLLDLQTRGVADIEAGRAASALLEEDEVRFIDFERSRIFITEEHEIF